MSWISVAIGVAGLAVTTYSTLKSTNNQHKATEYGMALSTLSYQDQQVLNEKILRAQTQTERLKIIADAVASIKEAQATQAQKNKNTTTILIVAGAVGVLMAAYFIKKS